MKTFILLLAAAVTVAGVAHAARNHGSQDTPQSGADVAGPEPGERLAMSIGRPNALTPGEQQQVVFLLPGTDPASIPPEKWGRVRAILYGDFGDADKKTRLRNLLRR